MPPADASSGCRGEKTGEKTGENSGLILRGGSPRVAGIPIRGIDAMGGVTRSIKRSVRQLIAFAIAGGGGYMTFVQTRERGIFHAFQGGELLLPAAAAVVAFFVLFWAAMTFISGRAAT